MKRLLAPLRIVALLLHLLAGVAIAAAIFPWLAQPRRNRIIRDWSRALLALCGMRLRLAGNALSAQLARTGVESWSSGRLLLANHVSWIDAFALNASLPCRFVAKAEIGRWPLLGALVSLVGTLYIERGRRHAVAAVNHRVRERLKRGETVAVFAEGTTTDGTTLLPFHSNLVAPAIEVGCDIWPVALAYTQGGVRSTAPAFVGRIGFVGSLWNILVARQLLVEVAFLDPQLTTGDPNRHHLAEAARQRIARHLGLAAPSARGATPAPAVDTKDKAPEPASGPASATR